MVIQDWQKGMDDQEILGEFYKKTAHEAPCNQAIMHYS